MGIRKCIRFTLPRGAGGMAAAHYLPTIRNKMRKFCNFHNIEGFESATEDYQLYVFFSDEKYLTLIMLAWENTGSYDIPTIVEKDLEKLKWNIDKFKNKNE